MVEELQYLDPIIHEVFIEEKKFNDPFTVNKIWAVVSQFLSLCPDARISKKLENIKTNYPKASINGNIFQKPGFRLLLLGIPFSINSGVVTVLKNITRAFVMQGANVAIVNHWWHKYSYWDTKTKSPVQVRLSPYSLLTGDGKLVSLRWALKQVLQELKTTYSYYPNVCHVHTHTFFEDNSIQFFSSYFPDVPIIYTLHAFIPFLRMSKEDKLRLLGDEMTHEEIMDIRKHNYKGRERSQEGMIVLADKVVTISQVHKDAFDKIYPEFKNKSVCIPNGTDMELYADFIDVHRMAQQLRQQIAPNGERVVIYTGRVEVQKGAIPLFKGINAIAEKYQDVKFVLIGSNPDIEDKLLSFGLNPIFKNKIHYTGWIKDRKVLAAYYKLADVMVQPVFSKNLYAMVALEAMILKVPVVSCPGELTIGTCESAESILKAVDLVFINKEAVKRHVEHVRGVVMQDYSLTAVYKKHIELYANARKISSSKRLVA